MSDLNANGRGATAHARANGLQSESTQRNWAMFVRFCAELGHGEIEKLKIQDGVPVLAECITRKVRFGP